jgi:hypothetical protein
MKHFLARMVKNGNEISIAIKNEVQRFFSAGCYCDDKLLAHYGWTLMEQH